MRISSVLIVFLPFFLSAGTIEENTHRFEFIGEPYDTTAIINYLARYNIPFSEEKLMESSKKTEKNIYILVDMGIYPDISDAVSQYITDLENNGYTVTLWGVSGGTPEDIKGLLQSGYGNGIEGAVLIGDIIARLSIIGFPPGPGQCIPYPCDLYYEDLDGEWTLGPYHNDTVLTDHTDGAGDVAPEIYIGRILPKRKKGNDAELINNYLTRIHTLRQGNYSLGRGYNALEFIDDDWAGYTEHSTDKWKTYDNQVKQGFSHRDAWVTPWGATEDTTIRAYYTGDLPERGVIYNQYEWARPMVHGAYPEPDSPAFENFKYFGSFEQNEITPLDIGFSNRGMFYDLFSCWGGIYSLEDYMGSYYLFGTDSEWKTVALLASAKSGGLADGTDFYRFFGRGLNLGEAFLRWFQLKGKDGFDNFEREWYYGMTILGDPTLHSYNFTYGLDEYVNFPNIVDTISTGVEFVDIDLDGTDEFLTYNNNSVSLFRLDGNPVWAVPIPNDKIYNPAICDIDGDGQLEIVIGIKSDFDSGRIIVLDRYGNELFDLPTNIVTSPPAIFDFDNDGKKEIVVSEQGNIEKNNKAIQVFDCDGNETWNYQTQGGAKSISIGDINGDREYDMVFMGNFSDTIYAFTYSSGFVALWKEKITGVEKSCLSIGDARDIGKEDIIVGALGKLYILDGTGEIIKSFDVDSVPASPIIANIDNDPYLEPMAITSNGIFYIFPDIVTNSGISVEKKLPLDGESSPSIADVTGDNKPEIILPTYRGIFLLHNDGTKVYSGEYFGKGTEFSGILSDVDGDGKVEYGYGDYFGNIHLQPFNAPVSNYSWLEGRADRWNTGNTSDRIPPLPSSGLTANLEWIDYPYTCIVHLNWNDNKDIDLDHYNVYERRSGETNYTMVGSNTLSSYDRTLYPFPGKKYFYYVKAVDKNENLSSHSNVAFVLPLDYDRSKGGNLTTYIDLGKEKPSSFLLHRDGIVKNIQVKDFTLFPDFDADRGNNILLYSIPPEYAGNYVIFTMNPGHLLITAGSKDKEVTVQDKGDICVFKLPEISGSKDILLRIIGLGGDTVEASEMLIVNGGKGSTKMGTCENTEGRKSTEAKSTKIFCSHNRLIVSSGEKIKGDWIVKIYNITGRKIYIHSFTRQESRIEIDTQNLPSGVYFVKVSGGLNAFGKVMVIK